MKTFNRLPLLGLVLLGLAACSGGAGGGGNESALTSLPAQPATVGVLLTDAQGTRWDEAHATITSIELIGDDYRQTIYTGNETVDLLSLPDYFELFTIAPEVFPGTVNKVRLQLDRLELVDYEDAAAPGEPIPTKLVGNGKMDIVPQGGSFTIAGGDALLIELDFDMDRTFKATETGNGQIIVRPVIFAHVSAAGGSSRLTRVFGEVMSVDFEAGTLVLCQTGLSANHEEKDDHEDDGDSSHDHCIAVAADDLTGVFSAEGLPVTFNDVAVGDQLTAVGFLRHDEGGDDDSDNDDSMSASGKDEGMDDGGSENHDEGLDDHDGDGDVEDDFVLDAVVLEVGTDFVRYAGAAQSAVDGDFFDFLLGPNQGFEPETVIATQLFASTRVFSRTGEELDQQAIAPDATGIVDGIIVPGAQGMDDTLSAALIVLDPDAGTTEELLSGEIVSVLEGEGTFQLLVGEMPRCIDASGAEISLVSAGDSMSSEPATLAELMAGMQADVYGEEGVDGCFVASQIRATPSSSP